MGKEKKQLKTLSLPSADKKSSSGVKGKTKTIKKVKKSTSKTTTTKTAAVKKVSSTKKVVEKEKKLKSLPLPTGLNSEEMEFYNHFIKDPSTHSKVEQSEEVIESWNHYGAFNFEKLLKKGYLKLAKEKNGKIVPFRK